MTNGFSEHNEKAREIRQDPVLRGIQDVAISTRIAISSAAKALDYAETTLREVSESKAKAVGEKAKFAKQRAADIKKAETKLRRAMDEMKKASANLDSSLRGRSK